MLFVILTAGLWISLPRLIRANLPAFLNFENVEIHPWRQKIVFTGPAIGVTEECGFDELIRAQRLVLSMQWYPPAIEEIFIEGARLNLEIKENDICGYPTTRDEDSSEEELLKHTRIFVPSGEIHIPSIDYTLKLQNMEGELVLEPGWRSIRSLRGKIVDSWNGKFDFRLDAGWSTPPTKGAIQGRRRLDAAAKIVGGWQNLTVFNRFMIENARIISGAGNVEVKLNLKEGVLEADHFIQTVGLKLGGELRQGLLRISYNDIVEILEVRKGVTENNIRIAGRIDKPGFNYVNLLTHEINTKLEAKIRAHFMKIQNLLPKLSFWP